MSQYKRKNAVILFSFLALLASCTPGNTPSFSSEAPSISESPSSSETTSTPSSESSSPSSEQQPSVNKELLAQRLNAVVEAQSYRLKKESLLEDSDEEDFEDVYVPSRYVRLESKKVSHILRSNLQDPSKTSSYEFLHKGTSLELLSIDSQKTEGGYAPLESLSSFNPLSEYLDPEGKGTFLAKDFLLNIDEYVINDFGIVYSLATLLNLKERAANEQFVFATFSLDEADNLCFTLVSSTDGFEFTDYARGTFLDLGHALSEPEETYFKNPTSPTFASPSELSPFQKGEFTFRSDIYEHQGSEEYGYFEGTNVLSLGATSIHHAFGYDSHYYVNDNGSSIEISLNGENEISRTPTGLDWSSYVYLKDALNEGNLAKTGSNSYRYLGSDPFSLFYGITLAKSLGTEDIKSIDFTLSGGKLAGIEVKFNEVLDPTNFYDWDWYAAHVTVQEGASIELPTPLQEQEDGSLPDIQKTLSYFKKTFRLKLYDAADPSNAAYLTYSNVPGARYLLREEKTLKPGSLSEYSSKRIGYAYNGEGKLVKFLYSALGEVYALQEPMEKSLEDVLGMNLSPLLLKKATIDGESCYNLRTPIYDLTSSFAGYKHLDAVRPMTFRLYYNTNAAKKPLSYSYRYEYNGGQSKGQEIGEFIAIGDEELDGEIDTALVEKAKQLTAFSAPSTWEMEENVYPTLVSFLGEEKAKLIPYVYEETLFDHWYAITTNLVGGKPTHLVIYLPDASFSFSDPTHYMERLKAKIAAIPNIEQSHDGDGKEVYYLKEGDAYTLAIALGSNPKEGIDLYIPD